ncbi:MAG TPA: hypothetical protein VFV66_14565 [Nonomuraea sp.]|nr:hypothetical protein [Nonomuraea sp.]
MNRVVKAAVAATAFGLAAALAVPAQAEVQYDTARHATSEGLGEGASIGGSPLGGLLGGVPLLGGLLGGGAGGLLGGGKAKSAGAPAQSGAQMTEAERDAAIELQGPRRAGAPNAAEDVTRTGGPLPELSPILGGAPLGGAGLTGAVPLLSGGKSSGSARMGRPAAASVKQSQGQSVQDAFASVGGLVESSVQGAVGKLSGTGLLPDTGQIVNGGAAAKGMQAPTTDAMLAGLTRAARLALPTAATGELSPVVGQVAPAEMAPVIETLPGATQAASVDDLTPLVEGASGVVYSKGTKATGSYSDLMTALGWTTDALTSSARDAWIRG